MSNGVAVGGRKAGKLQRYEELKPILQLQGISQFAKRPSSVNTFRIWSSTLAGLSWRLQQDSSVQISSRGQKLCEGLVPPALENWGFSALR